MTVPFTQELTESVRSIALGQRRVAALGQVPYLRDRDRWRPIPLPPAFNQALGQSVTIYMGRDDRPRLMGHYSAVEPSTAATRLPLYLRYLDHGWVTAYDELGRLGGKRPGALFGVLGYDDPEVVCKEEDGCLVKRRTGWTSIGCTELGTVRLTGEAVFALSASQVSRLTNGGFVQQTLAVGSGQVRDLWEVARGDLWAVVEPPGGTALFHIVDGEAKEVPVPIGEPRALFASAPDDLWIAGDGGLAWYDGHTLRRVLGAQPPLSCIGGRGRDTLWVGGPSGLFRRGARPGEAVATR
ncbi:MAG: hypothetical protein JW751_27705 [Polyangiaceae bacterium]|nr:hypothetical protein [Polyangiaceae bacterium]